MIQKTTARPVVPPGGVIIAPTTAAYADLTSNGVFAKKLPTGFNAVNWLDQPVTVLAGVSAAAVKTLAKQGVSTVRQLAVADIAWGTIGLARSTALACNNAQLAIEATAQKYGFAIAPGATPPATITTFAIFTDPVTGRGYSR